MIDFTMCLPAVTFDALSGSSKIFNKRVVDGHNLWATLPRSISVMCEIAHIREISGVGSEIDLSNVFREGSIIRLAAGAINRDAGLHQYEIGMRNILTEDMVYCYIQYIIQDDNPETPYIYMKREESSSDDSSNLLEQDIPSEQETEGDSTED